MKYIPITLLALLISAQAISQTTKVCGNDTIVLELNNFDGIGTIAWQESLDSINWTTIPEAYGPSYKFYPLQSKYYRGVVKTANCPPLYSAQSFVQVVPVANAGIDRTIGGKSMLLKGNKAEGAIGKWTVLSGDSSAIQDVNNPNTLFSGTYNQHYILEWSLTNECGQTSDTVSVNFEEFLINTNFVIVDNTDEIMSDSIDLVNGIYRIKFSDPEIQLHDSLLLVGIREDWGFLRKINSFEYRDSIYTIQTTQGMIEDILKNGTLNIGDMLNETIFQSSLKPQLLPNVSKRITSLNFPTRETLKNLPYSENLIVLYQKNEINNRPENRSIRSRSSEPFSTVINFPDVSLFEKGTSDKKISVDIKDAYLSMTPNFVADISRLQNIKIGLDNAVFDFNYKLIFSALERKKLTFEPITIPLGKFYFVYYVGVLPIPSTANINLIVNGDANATAKLSYEINVRYTKHLTAIAQGNIFKGLSYEKPTSTGKSTMESKFSMNGQIDAGIEIGPEISFLLFDYTGPYFSLPLRFQTSLCVNQQSNWHNDFDIIFRGKLGVKRFFGNHEWTMFEKSLIGTIKSPTKIELLSGNNQIGIEGEILPNPISVKVVNSLGIAMPGVPVRFNTVEGSGSVDPAIQHTNMKGIVSANWRLGSNDVNTLEVSTLDCNNQNIENSPIIVYANKIKCVDSNLQLVLYTDDSTVVCGAIGGEPPYSYTTNGIDYTFSKPKINIKNAGRYIVIVKDAYNCMASRAFTIKEINECLNNNLNLTVNNYGNLRQIIGTGGLSPYQYAIDDLNSFTSTNRFFNLSEGSHIAYIKDASGCIVSDSIFIKKQTAVINALQPADNSTLTKKTNINFTWQAGNYAPNQRYSLTLQKITSTGEEEPPTLMNEYDLTSEYFSYPGLVSDGTRYNWTVSVLTEQGIVDSRTFTFTTATSNITTPNIPTLVEPANNSINQLSTVTLRWNKQKGDFVYDLFFDDTSASKLIATNLTDSSYILRNLASDKKYYWKVKIKNKVTGERKESSTWNFTPYVSHTVTDIDGNTYSTVKIGTQIWMRENLKTKRYRNGDSIPNITDRIEWSNSNTGAYCSHNNSAENESVYGNLYNWYAVEDIRGIAPEGWRVPTDEDWKKLQNFLGENETTTSGLAGTKLKEKGSAHWAGTNSLATNETGFTALPGDYRSNDGSFYMPGYYGNWWTSSETDSLFSSSRSMGYDYNGLNRISYSNKKIGMSIRCIKDTLIEGSTPSLLTVLPINIQSTSVIAGINITSDGGDTITRCGICWNTKGNPTINDQQKTVPLGKWKHVLQIDSLEVNTTYFLRAFATNNKGISYGNEFTITTRSMETVRDIDGNNYKTMTIGNQTWMVENLRTTRYRNGNYIGTTFPGNKDISTQTKPSYQWSYNDAEHNVNKYGRLYTWHAVTDPRGIAPAGWHIPSNEEWQTLRTYLISIGYSYDFSTFGDDIAKSLCSGELWNSYNKPGSVGNEPSSNNLSGFSALPAGGRYKTGFSEINSSASFWTSTAYTSATAWYVNMHYTSTKLMILANMNNFYGFSIRCIKD